MESTKCVICLNDCLPQVKVEHCEEGISNNIPDLFVDSTTTENCPSLKKQLPVIFLLRRFLEVPENICCTFLQEYGDPWTWTDCCETCSVLVDRAKYIYDKIASLQREYETLQAAVRMSVLQSVQFNQPLGGSTSGACQTIRLYISEISNINLENNGENDMNWTPAASDCGTEDSFDDDLKESPALYSCSVCLKIFKSALVCKYHERNHKREMSNWGKKPKPRKRKTPIPRALKRKEIKVESENTCEIKTVFQRRRRCTDKKSTCNVCGKITTRGINFRRHMETHNKDRNLKPKPRRPPKRYTCPVCGKITTRSINHERHMATHDKNKLRNYMCPVCNEMFVTPRDLSKHLRANHKGVKPFKCPTPTCGKGFTDTSDLRKHMGRHTGRGHQCSLCPKKFLSPIELKRHEETHTRTREPLICDQCGKNFVRQCKLDEHVKRVHIEGITPTLFSCSLCDKTFNRKFDLQSHQVRHTGEKNFMCEICGKKYALKSDIRLHMRRHKNKKEKEKVAVKLDCEICGRVSKTKSQLKKHIEIHGERPFVCPVCGKAFLRSKILRKHVLKHEGEKPLKCEECGRGFMDAGPLAQHMKNVHEGIKPHPCPYCDKRFVKARDMNAHILTIHTEVRPFCCKICDKTFSLEKKLREHLKTHQKQKKIKVPKTFSIKCEICDVKFDRFIEYKHHKREHAGAGPNTCDACEKSLPTEKALQKHMRKMHKKFKNFECEICGKRFAATRLLGDHVNIHTGKKPYACGFEDCDAHFASDRNVRCHRLTHTKKKEVYILPPEEVKAKAYKIIALTLK